MNSNAIHSTCADSININGTIITNIILPTDDATSPKFGGCVARSENFIVVCSKGDTHSNGSIYVFEKNESSARTTNQEQWYQSYKWISLGYVVSVDININENFIIVGTTTTQISGPDVYIFEHDVINNTWHQIAQLGKQLSFDSTTMELTFSSSSFHYY